MIVTDIKTVTKQKYRIELDGQPAFVLYKGELFRYKIKKDEELPEAVFMEITGQVLVKRAKLRAMHLLERMDRTKADLERKLKQGEYPKEAIDAAVAYVESFGYLDDKRYAASYVQMKKDRIGKARLKMELMQKGVDKQLIEDVLEEEDLGDSRDAIRTLAEKKLKGRAVLEEGEKRRIYNFLLRKGFSSSDILSVLKEREDFC